MHKPILPLCIVCMAFHIQTLCIVHMLWCLWTCCHFHFVILHAVHVMVHSEHAVMCVDHDNVDLLFLTVGVPFCTLNMLLAGCWGTTSVFTSTMSDCRVPHRMQISIKIRCLIVTSEGAAVTTLSEASENTTEAQEERPKVSGGGALVALVACPGCMHAGFVIILVDWLN